MSMQALEPSEPSCSEENLLRGEQTRRRISAFMIGRECRRACPARRRRSFYVRLCSPDAIAGPIGSVLCRSVLWRRFLDGLHLSIARAARAQTAERAGDRLQFPSPPPHPPAPPP